MFSTPSNRVTPRFRDRAEAGSQLAELLGQYAGRTEVLVLALPRGGVPVGREVARALKVPLDVFVVRKLGVPGHEELAMGAIASGGIQVLNEEVVRSLNISPETIEAVARNELKELARREETYRGQRPAIPVLGRTVILVDDGIATGSSMRAAVQALRQLGAASIVVAVPTAAPSTAEEMAREVDDLITVITPRNFAGVGQWYEDFSQTTDAEVRDLLK
jgi:putative phosphoribosyl transferase